ncbi:TCP-1 CPN60 chaperonin family protein [Cryptosporidium andersoni]|uniref:T-complex protein 1 subunit eta n=1 Tax=Cryptosporidium andersoni TaxID=117008 RepID=A0A1J4MWR5_9CRYT|nr:TCP-1 CPN60 chaperonin family protein [Cryptosporidium andersoni]
MAQMLRAPIILLREGVDTSQGRGQILSNINACQIVVDIVRTTLGPCGMDKLIKDGDSNGVTITNDGATVLNLLGIVHPAAKLLVDIARSQDDEVGDGTTSVVVLAGELLKEARSFIEDGMSPQVIISGFRKACKIAVERINTLQVNLSEETSEVTRNMLIKCAETTLNSKLLAHNKTHFATMVVDAVSYLDDELNKDLIGIKKVTGGSVLDSFLLRGVAFKKTFSYAGFEQQPKRFDNPKILLLNLELELKAEKDNAEVRLTDPSSYQSIVDAEWKIIFDKLDIITATGANVVLSRLAIGDLATQYFAEKHIFCAGRVEEQDLKRTALATGAVVQTTVYGLKADSGVFGTCSVFEEVQIGAERYNLFNDCPKTRSATMVLRGGAQQFIDEAERSLNDAIMVVRRAMKSSSIVPGGGAIEMALSKSLREYSRSISGKEQLVINYFARALESIPRALATNSGFDPIDILNKLRQKHAQNDDDCQNYGVDCNNGGICDSLKCFVWEPTVVKLSALSSATEAVCAILSVDETIKNPSSQEDRMQAPMPGMGKGMK